MLSPVPNFIVEEIVFGVAFIPFSVKEIIVFPSASVVLFGDTVIRAFVSEYAVTPVVPDFAATASAIALELDFSGNDIVSVPTCPYIVSVSVLL